MDPYVACTRLGEWPLHGPFPLASFGMEGDFRHLTLPALAWESGHCMAPFLSLRLAWKATSVTLRCLHSLGRVAIAWPLSSRFVWQYEKRDLPHQV